VVAYEKGLPPISEIKSVVTFSKIQQAGVAIVLQTCVLKTPSSNLTRLTVILIEVLHNFPQFLQVNNRIVP
jgi:hypothetical protein